MFKKLIATAAMIATVTGFTCTVDGSQGLLPENDLWISSSVKSINGIDKTIFNDVIDKVVKIYAPIVSQQGGDLKVARNWDDGTVNAYASRSGDTWNVAMFGGLARHSSITADGFALVVCHELGHHIGGAPKKTSFLGGTRWASNEGQSDYFATLKCLRRVFRAENNAAIVAKLEIPKAVFKRCNEQFSDKTDQLICQRGAMAGFSTASLFQALRSQTTAPSFITPDTKIVKKTDHNHPATQCRLDTYYAGATCTVDEMIDVDQEDEAPGVCYRDSGDTMGTRPLCWFKPKK